MDKIFYTNAELTEKSGVPQGSDLPQIYFELLEFDLSSLPKGVTIYDIEWTSENGVTTDLNQAVADKNELLKSDKKVQLLNACTQYQQGQASPRIDSNFFSLLTSASAVKKINPALETPKCEANISWCDSLWADNEQRKLDVDNDVEVSYDFSNNGNPPYKFDECRSELI